jgi:hypothetical protein
VRLCALSLTAVSTPGMLTQIEGGHFAAGQPTRYLPQSLAGLGLVSGFCADKALRQIEKAADGLFHSETPTSAKVPDPRDRPIVPAHLTTESLDIAKCVFQVHGADAAGHVLFRKRVTRAKLLGFPAAQNASRWKPVPAPIIGRARSASWAIACD